MTTPNTGWFFVTSSLDGESYHQDVLGNVVALTNEAGALAQEYRYTVWGEPSVYDSSFVPHPSSLALSPFLFTAREYDPETDLYHYRARAYSPDLGRFLHFDPIDFSSASKNLLQALGNSPFLLIDPYGLCDTLGSKQGSFDSGFIETMKKAMIDARKRQIEDKEEMKYCGRICCNSSSSKTYYSNPVRGPLQSGTGKTIR